MPRGMPGGRRRVIHLAARRAVAGGQRRGLADLAAAREAGLGKGGGVGVWVDNVPWSGVVA